MDEYRSTALSHNLYLLDSLFRSYPIGKMLVVLDPIFVTEL